MSSGSIYMFKCERGSWWPAPCGHGGGRTRGRPCGVRAPARCGPEGLFTLHMCERARMPHSAGNACVIVIVCSL